MSYTDKPGMRGDRSAKPAARGDATAPNEVAWWNKTWNMMIVALAIWAFFSFVIHLFAPQLNSIVILGFPLGFYMAAQGSLIAFVVLLFWFARAQDAVDREFGVAEDD